MTEHTFYSARIYVLDAINEGMKANGEEDDAVDRYDAASIVMDLHETFGTYDLSIVDDDAFWAAVQRHRTAD